MKKVFLFIHDDEGIARIIDGYTSKTAISAAGLNTNGDFVQKHASVDEAKRAARTFDPNCQIKVHSKK